MKTKKILCIVLALAMICLLAACGGEGVGNADGSDNGDNDEGEIVDNSDSDNGGSDEADSGESSDVDSGLDNGDSGSDNSETDSGGSNGGIIDSGDIGSNYNGNESNSGENNSNNNENKNDSGENNSGGNTGGGSTGGGSSNGGNNSGGSSSGGSSSGGNNSGGSSSGGDNSNNNGGGNSGDGGANLTSTAEDVLGKLISDLQSANVEMPMSLPPTEVAPELSQNTIGLSEADFGKLVSSASYSMAAIGTFAHQIIVIKANDVASAGKIKSLVSGSNGYDPKKWICVFPEKVISVDSGEYVLIVASYNAVADAALKAFKEAAGSTGDVNTIWEFAGE